MARVNEKQAPWRNRIVGHGEESPEQLLAHPQNPKIHPIKQQTVLDGVLSDVGWITECIVNTTTKHVIDGHARIELAISRGEPTVPVTYVELDENEELEALVTFDAIGTIAFVDEAIQNSIIDEIDTDNPVVQAYLDELKGQENTGRGEAQSEQSITDDMVARWNVSLGQLWAIPSLSMPGAEHLLLCGDSGSSDSVQLLDLSSDAPVSLMVTDPPWNLGMNYGDVSDELSTEEYRDFTEKWFTLWKSLARHSIVMPGTQNIPLWMQLFPPYYIAPWIKTNSASYGMISLYHKADEILFYDTDWMVFYGEGWRRRRISDVFDHAIGAQADVGDHPSPKPLSLWIDFLQSYTEEEDVIIDPFMGTGSTIVAGERTRRLAKGCELSTRYCAVILERLNRMGLQPRLVT